MLEFYNIFLSTGRHLPLSIIKKDFDRSNLLFVFYLNHGEDAETLSPASNGSVQFEITFKQPVPNTVMFIVYACYNYIFGD